VDGQLTSWVGKHAHQGRELRGATPMSNVQPASSRSMDAACRLLLLLSRLLLLLRLRLRLLLLLVHDGQSRGTQGQGNRIDAARRVLARVFLGDRVVGGGVDVRCCSGWRRRCRRPFGDRWLRWELAGRGEAGNSCKARARRDRVLPKGEWNRLNQAISGRTKECAKQGKRLADVGQEGKAMRDEDGDGRMMEEARRMGGGQPAPGGEERLRVMDGACGGGSGGGGGGRTDYGAARDGSWP